VKASPRAFLCLIRNRRASPLLRLLVPRFAGMGRPKAAGRDAPLRVERVSSPAISAHGVAGGPIPDTWTWCDSRLLFTVMERPQKIRNEAKWIKDCTKIRARALELVEGRISLIDASVALQTLAFATHA
jgi:hypothetical protein